MTERAYLKKMIDPQFVAIEYAENDDVYIYLSIHPSIYLSIHLSILSIYLSIYI